MFLRRFPVIWVGGGVDSRRSNATFLVVFPALIAVLAGCTGSPEASRGASQTTPARAGGDCVPKGWVVGEMVASDVAAVDRPAGASARARVLVWRTKEDGRPLYVESAIVWVQVEESRGEPRWLLLHVFRHPREMGAVESSWHLAQIADTSVRGIARFDAAPTRAEIEKFMIDSGWNEGMAGFEERAAGVCRAAWPEAKPRADGGFPVVAPTTTAP